MGSDFKIAIAKTLVNEGGYQADPNDHANWSGNLCGVGDLIGTKYGLTYQDLPGVDIKNLTEDQAIAYYAQAYWKTLYSQIDSQDVADKIFDMGVLFGIGTAVRILQLSVETTIDGVFGPNTLAAVNQSDPVSLLSTYKANLVTHAFNIGKTNPTERGFIAAWGRRINS